MFKYSKVRDVKSPLRANPTDAGVDLFVPEDLTMKDLERGPGNMATAWELRDGEIVLQAHSRIAIPSGLHVSIDDGWALVAANKSGVAAKRGLVFGAQVVDSGYQGEVHISVINTNSTPQTIGLGDKLIQVLYQPVSLEMPHEVPFDELYDKETSRGDGGFGSTDANDQVVVSHMVNCFRASNVRDALLMRDIMIELWDIDRCETECEKFEFKLDKEKLIDCHAMFGVDPLEEVTDMIAEALFDASVVHGVIVDDSVAEDRFVPECKVTIYYSEDCDED